MELCARRSRSIFHDPSLEICRKQNILKISISNVTMSFKTIIFKQMSHEYLCCLVLCTFEVLVSVCPKNVVKRVSLSLTTF